MGSHCTPRGNHGANDRGESCWGPACPQEKFSSYTLRDRFWSRFWNKTAVSSVILGKARLWKLYTSTIKKKKNYGLLRCHKILGPLWDWGTPARFTGKMGPPLWTCPPPPPPSSRHSLTGVYCSANACQCLSYQCIMEESEKEGKFEYSDIFAMSTMACTQASSQRTRNVLYESEPRSEFTKNEKRALRKRAKFFVAKGTSLYYVGGGKQLNFSLLCIDLLAPILECAKSLHAQELMSRPAVLRHSCMNSWLQDL